MQVHIARNIRRTAALLATALAAAGAAGAAPARKNPPAPKKTPAPRKAAPPVAPARPVIPAQPFQALRTALERVGLTSTQKARVDQLLDASHQDFLKIQAASGSEGEKRARFRKVATHMRDQLRALLSPAQQRRLHEQFEQQGPAPKARKPRR